MNHRFLITLLSLWYKSANADKWQRQTAERTGVPVSREIKKGEVTASPLYHPDARLTGPATENLFFHKLILVNAFTICIVQTHQVNA